MRWLSNVCFSWKKKRDRESRNWNPEALVCLKKRLSKFTFNDPTNSLNVFVLLRWWCLRCLETWEEHMFGPYMVFRAQYPAAFRTFYFAGFKAGWKLFSTHVPESRLSYISAFNYTSHMAFLAEVFKFEDRPVIVNPLKVVYWKVDL